MGKHSTIKHSSVISIIHRNKQNWEWEVPIVAQTKLSNVYFDWSKGQGLSNAQLPIHLLKYDLVFQINELSVHDYCTPAPYARTKITLAYELISFSVFHDETSIACEVFYSQSLQ